MSRVQTSVAAFLLLVAALSDSFGVVTACPLVELRAGEVPIVRDQVMKTYDVPAERLDMVFTMLDYQHKGKVTVRVWKLGDKQIMVWAGADDQEDIAKLIRKVCATRGA